MNKYIFIFLLILSPFSKAALSNSCFNQGNIDETGRGLDIAIVGQGWIPLRAENGSLRFTRDGSLGTNEEGFLIHRASGLPVVHMVDGHLEKVSLKKYETKNFALKLGHEPGRKARMTNMSFEPNGDLTVSYSDGDTKTIANIYLAVIENQSELLLEDKEKHLFKGSEKMGEIAFAMATTNSTGKIYPRSLERQNVYEQECR